MVDIQSVTVQLGTREFVIAQAGFMRSKPWKQRFLTEVKPLFAEIGESQTLEFKKPADLIVLLPLAEKLFVDALDLLFELLVTYSPALEEDREYIAANATDQQIFVAFQEVVKLADFFGLTQTLMRQIGLHRTGTS